MLHLIQTLGDKLLDLLSQDPIRPHIPASDRVGDNKVIFVLRNEHDEVRAITCVSYQSSIPASEQELFNVEAEPDTAVFYTIWSYKPGAGKELIFDAVRYIKENNKNITKFVTLSPKTEMAKRFHTKNGAVIFRENAETTNYQYLDR
ncbi:hypothetical protein UFOVP71_118 [uncultured Caudovirales phage]|uniref:N-acetyltransferase domain-containing protein n=1 Tax=uncultured Caudovirales phage TaxID=2100421 RepID=A0A6J5TD76_9CAUD|nr:hypothetical protein UFOVP71_118 [uncultured Caudovirales phage]